MNLKLLQSFQFNHPIHFKNYAFLGSLGPLYWQIHPQLSTTSPSSKTPSWTEHTVHFNAIKTRIANHTENTHYMRQVKTRIKCDASSSGLGSALEQLTVNGWKPVSFASRFLNSNEKRYSINQLELLGVVWSREFFKKLPLR